MEGGKKLAEREDDLEGSREVEREERGARERWKEKKGGIWREGREERTGGDEGPGRGWGEIVVWRTPDTQLDTGDTEAQEKQREGGLRRGPGRRTGTPFLPRAPLPGEEERP